MAFTEHSGRPCRHGYPVYTALPRWWMPVHLPESGVGSFRKTASEDHEGFASLIWADLVAGGDQNFGLPKALTATFEKR